MKCLVIFLALVACCLAASIPKPTVKPLIGTRPRSARVSGGQEVNPPHSLPYQAALYLGGAFCGAIVIAPRWILTTASCAGYSSRPQVILGAQRIDYPEDSQTVVVGIRSIVHEEWNGEPIVNDIGLIELPEDLTFDKYIQPINLAPANASTYVGENAVASGWGVTSDFSDEEISSQLHKTTAKILSNPDCQEAFFNNIPIYDTIICMDGSLGHSICAGDAGGPLVVGDTVVGVISFGYVGGCEEGFPSGATRVSSYRDWIDEKINQ